MGVPVAISDGTLYIDVDTDTVGLAYNQEENKPPKTEKFVRNNTNIKNFMMASGLMGSYLEGYVVGEATNTKGVSSVSIIKESKERGINIVTLSEENKAILNTLSIDKTAKNEIEKALNNGKTVIVPEKSIQYYDWNGTGYITLNPETGEAAYMISGGLCGGESSQDLAMTLFTIIVAVAAIFAIAVFVYFAWSAIAAMIGVALTISEGISILDTCIILLSMAGAIFSITEAGNVGIDAYEYIIDPSVENGSDILRKAVEAGAMFLIFEVAMPRLISSVSAKINFDESGFYKFVTKKWGGKTIKTPPVKPDAYPDLNPDADPDTNSNKRPLGDYWEKIAEKYGQDIVDKLRPFGDDGKRLIEQYGDELVDIIKELSEDDTKLAIQLVKEYGNDAVKLFKDGKDVEAASKIIKLAKGKSNSNISKLLSIRPELTGTNREKLLSLVQDNNLAKFINEVYRPGATIGDGGTADALISEFYEGNSTHLLKAQERLKGINKIINSGKLGLNDLDIAEALRDDLEYAIRLFK